MSPFPSQMPEAHCVGQMVGASSSQFSWTFWSLNLSRSFRCKSHIKGKCLTWGFKEYLLNSSRGVRLPDAPNFLLAGLCIPLHGVWDADQEALQALHKCIFIQSTETQDTQLIFQTPPKFWWDNMQHHHNQVPFWIWACCFHRKEALVLNTWNYEL